MTGVEPEEKERVLLFNREGRLNLTQRDLLQIVGLINGPAGGSRSANDTNVDNNPVSSRFQLR